MHFKPPLFTCILLCYDFGLYNENLKYTCNIKRNENVNKITERKQNMRKIFSVIAAAIFATMVMVGCGTSETTKKVATDGSTSMNKVIGSLGEAFEAETGITVTYNATGSGAGIQAI